MKSYIVVLFSFLFFSCSCQRITIPHNLFSVIPFEKITDCDTNAFEYITTRVGTDSITFPIIPLSSGMVTNNQYDVICQGLITFFEDKEGYALKDSVKNVRLNFILISEKKETERTRLLDISYKNQGFKNYKIIEYRYDKNINKFFLEQIKENYIQTIRKAKFTPSQKTKCSECYFTLPYRIGSKNDY